MHPPPPVILFGAFDRHNVGDLLFPHVVAAMLGDAHPRCAGLAERDLRADGGHQVLSLRQHAASLRESPYCLIHAGGEILTCSAWEAAVMLLPPSDVLDVLMRLDGRPEAQRAWAAACLGMNDLVPYTASKNRHPGAAEVIFHAVGGADLDARPAQQRDEVIDKLAQADVVSVRDVATLEHLRAAGISARLIPDPAVMVAALFHARVSMHAMRGDPAQLRAAFPLGYVAVQFSTDFDDDASLAALAAQLDRLAAATGYGVALFRAGSAPWHDDLQAYRRLAARMTAPAVRIAATTGLWDICAIIASARLYIGSSLHGRILAMAYGLPRLNIRHPGHPVHGKQRSYAQTWDIGEMPAVVTPDALCEAAMRALAADARRLRQKAAELVALYRLGFARDVGDRTAAGAACHSMTPQIILPPPPPSGAG